MRKIRTFDPYKITTGREPKIGLNSKLFAQKWDLTGNSSFFSRKEQFIIGKIKPKPLYVFSISKVMAISISTSEDILNFSLGSKSHLSLLSGLLYTIALAAYRTHTRRYRYTDDCLACRADENYLVYLIK